MSNLGLQGPAGIAGGFDALAQMVADREAQRKLRLEAQQAADEQAIRERQIKVSEGHLALNQRSADAEDATARAASQAEAERRAIASDPSLAGHARVAKLKMLDPFSTVNQHQFDTPEELTSEADAAEATKIANIGKETRARLLAEQPFKAPSDGASTARSDARLDRSFQYNKTLLEKIRVPLSTKADRFATLSEDLAARNPVADALAAPLILSIVAGGPSTGLRMTEAELGRIVGGRSIWENLKAQMNRWKINPDEALSITDAQRGQMQKIMNAAYTRIRAKLDKLDTAGQALVDATDVTHHRQIVLDTQKALEALDAPAEGDDTPNPAAPSGDPLNIRKYFKK